MRTSTGELRPAYAPYVSEWGDSGLTKRGLKWAEKQSTRLFKGDNALSPVPRIFTREEFERLQRGVQQRATALRMFLTDHYSGEKTYREVIPLERVAAIIARTHEAGFEQLVRPSDISFLYGPDIIRDPEGNFLVVEDNIGYIGGMGDLQRARSTLFHISPGLEEKLPPLNDIDDFFRAMVAEAKNRANPSDGRVVMYMVPPYPDHENGRQAQIMEAHGVEFVTPRGPKQLFVTEDGVFMRSGPGAKPERVGFLFLNAEHRWVDATHPLTRRAYLLSEAEEALGIPKLPEKVRQRIAKALAPDPVTGEVSLNGLQHVLNDTGVLDKRGLKNAQAVPGLMEAIGKGQVATDYTPGTDFVGDKEFKQFVDALVRHYLAEEPLLPGIPVHSFLTRQGGQEVLDEQKVSQLLHGGAHQDFVFKVVNGRGGDGVYIGPKMTEDDVRTLEQKIRADPGMYVAEPFIPLSVHNGNIVDLRAISMVSPSGVTVAEPPWCRGVPLDGNGKVNLSSKGVEIAAIVLPAGD